MTTPIFPLTPFIISLSELDIYLTLPELRRIQQALSTKEEWTHQSLKQVLIALIAKDDQQQQDIERLYLRFQQESENQQVSQKQSQNIDTQALKTDLKKLLQPKSHSFQQQKKKERQNITKPT